jgi:multicomponent Na+:H+ antiporter subunit G
MKEIVISILLLAGSLFILVAAIGLLRFSDVLSRMHATTKATSFGLLLIVTGVALYFFTIAVFVKAVLVILFIYLTAPLAAHSISKTTHKSSKKE